jgi:hypothetical protein
MALDFTFSAWMKWLRNGWDLEEFGIGDPDFPGDIDDDMRFGLFDWLEF